MNVNEVIANRAIELLGGELGAKTPVHPNDDVNTVAVARTTRSRPRCTSPPSIAVEDELLPARRASCATRSRQKAEAFADIVKIGRTHLQDATPLTLGQEISRLGRAARRTAERDLEATLPQLLRARARRHGGRHRAERASRVRRARSPTRSPR